MKPSTYQEWLDDRGLVRGKAETYEAYAADQASIGVPIDSADHPSQGIVPSRKQLLTALRSLAEQLGHTPLDKEMGQTGYGRDRFMREFGSVRAALEEAGLSPNVRTKTKKKRIPEGKGMTYWRMSEVSDFPHEGAAFDDLD